MAMKAPTEESKRLARKAKMEKMEKGTVSTMCPKCHQKIKVYIFYDNGIFKSISVRCKCGYIFDGEIYD